MDQHGIDFQAGVPEASVRPASLNGRCVMAISFASRSATSAANCAGNLSCRMYRSLPPPGRRMGGASVAPSELPGKRPDSSLAVSPTSGANAETYTSAFMLLLADLAFVITVPPYEWPTSTIGPLMVSSTALT